MKKYFALALLLVSLFCLPSFAADSEALYPVKLPNGQTVQVKLDDLKEAWALAKANSATDAALGLDGGICGHVGVACYESNPRTCCSYRCVDGHCQ